MKVSDVVTELEMELEESQNQRDSRIEHLWKKLDLEQKGKLDWKGLQKGLRKIDHPLKNADDMLKTIIKTVDTDGDGKVSYEEFRVFVEATERQLYLLFKSIDCDNNGRLDKNELQLAFKRAGLAVPMRRLNTFFEDIDMNNDGYISFDEWRDFLLFMPSDEAKTTLHAVFTFYSDIVTLTSEGDSVVSDETLEGLGYFVAGAVAGGISRTATAPLDRLKVYLLVNTNSGTNVAIDAARKGRPVVAMKNAGRPLFTAALDLYKSGGLRGFFAGNGLNVIKIMPETAIRFGAYEAAKKTLARLEGHGDTQHINPISKFVAGGVAGMTAQFCVYPLDTLKFRLQSEYVHGGPRGNKLLKQVLVHMWADGGTRAVYRGVTMGLIGMFPYSAIDMGTFEFLKTSYIQYKAKSLGIHEEDAKPSTFATGIMGASSGAFGATVVYPLNVLRTRLQTQGTKMHPARYTGIWDVANKTIRNEGVRGLYKGLMPNLLKVAPALSITWMVYENAKRIMDLN
ncbi:calcium-binding mitochondrial carrier SAL1 [Pseudomassariella vexata]|uniref:Mitochondrial thiamine pyrophosphate carrier 1 n=1 Tax=Pseudomassariella vexata TaxID=1141098 RepID=A0A1Y2DYR2_9PEZI|nr:calcium-binding mitochondrial carrier SAL1 [Pseudomassariella vexata]ORY64224.1 calcium-binding mitochondrial carrier SAL1 [Pseudomassariella vexata]